MSLANKSFKNNKTGDLITVIDSFENIAILENKQKIDTRTLMDPNQYTEQIDPGSFFNNQGAYNILAEKIKNIPTSNLVDDDNQMMISSPSSDFGPATNESAIMMSSEDDERAELARKYGVSQENSSALNRQNEAFSKLLGDDSEIQKVEINRDMPKQPIQPIERAVYNEPVQKIQRVEVEDPIIKMFQGVKRNVDFNISIDIDNKIPRLDFIEMMEDSYETSIIEFLSDEFTKDIINNPQIIRSIISEKIKSMVYKKSDISVNPQITDAVTQVDKQESLTWEKEPVLSKDLETPKKTTKKPRSSTAKSEKLITKKDNQ